MTFLAMVRLVLHDVDQLTPLILQGNASAIRTASRQIDTLLSEDICRELPCDFTIIKDPIVATDLRVTQEVGDVVAFAFKNKGASLPLHDHPNVTAFLKVVRGAFKVRSFSPIPDAEGKWTTFRYEGESILTPASSCIVVQPIQGNLHEIHALEDGSTFFDIQIPGQNFFCKYYSLKGKSYDQLQKGDAVELDTLKDFQAEVEIYKHFQL